MDWSSIKWKQFDYHKAIYQPNTHTQKKKKKKKKKKEEEEEERFNSRKLSFNDFIFTTTM